MLNRKSSGLATGVGAGSRRPRLDTIKPSRNAASSASLQAMKSLSSSFAIRAKKSAWLSRSLDAGSV